jgi:hypothetical protein
MSSLFQMGMPLYRYQTPEGYKNTQVSALMRIDPGVLTGVDPLN